jgi:hypothetical protein
MHADSGLHDPWTSYWRDARPHRSMHVYHVYGPVFLFPLFRRSGQRATAALHVPPITPRVTMRPGINQSISPARGPRRLPRPCTDGAVFELASERPRFHTYGTQQPSTFKVTNALDSER